jgi:hypothetical protein
MKSTSVVRTQEPPVTSCMCRRHRQQTARQPMMVVVVAVTALLSAVRTSCEMRARETC